MDQIQSDHPDSQLHLPNLTIKEFRGIKTLSIPELGRVTLFAGKNAVGKTSVLESVAIFATRGHLSNLLPNLDKIQKDRDEIIFIEGKSDHYPYTDALFYRQGTSEKKPIVIGLLDDQTHQLRIEKVPFNRLNQEQKKSLEGQVPIKPYIIDNLPQFFTVKFADKEALLPWTISHSGSDTLFQPLNLSNYYYEKQVISPKIPYKTLGTGPLSNQQIANLWDEIALTDRENQTIEALKLIFENIDRVTVTVASNLRRRAIVKLRDHPEPVPLKNLGDGAVRLFSISLALANSHGGILTIDEAENGIHHSVQRDFWKMILQTAYKNNIQVLATTHSWDCTRGFAQAALENKNSKGLLIRLIVMIKKLGQFHILKRS